MIKSGANFGGRPEHFLRSQDLPYFLLVVDTPQDNFGLAKDALNIRIGDVPVGHQAHHLIGIQRDPHAALP